MRALDGTYWRFKRPNGCVSEMKAPTKWQILVWHNPELGRPVRIRPRMSIVRAVRLLMEARDKGVELWMRFDFCWVKYCTRYGFVFRLETGTWNDYRIGECDIAAKWIVATPEDARRIDAKRGGK